MKKILLSGVALTMLAGSASAQLALENFNAGFPATWSMVKVDNNTPSSQWVPAIVTGLTNKAWMTWPKGSGDSCMLTTSVFSPAGTADRWIISPAFTVNDPNMVLSWDGTSPDANGDQLQVLVSPTAGTTTSSFTATVYNNTAPLDWAKSGASLGAYNGQTIRVAFRNNSTNKYVLMIDNVSTAVLPAKDGAITSLYVPQILTSSSSQVAIDVKNNGAQNITSLKLSYKIDANTPITQTFTGLSITPYGTQTLTFTTPISGLSQGSHSILVTLMETNGAADPVTANNTANTNFTLPNGSTPRNGLIEEFTSSTCNPCASFNVTFDPLILSNNANVPSSHFNIIKYQMNWPSPGNDASYNNDGSIRRGAYGVTGIPDHYTNGAVGGSGNQSEIDGSKTAAAYASFTGSYTVKGDSIVANISMKPNFTLQGGNFKLFMAATEAHYTNNGATTSQKEYYHVMRKMLPDANGTTVANFTNGVNQNFRFAYKFQVGSVTQGSFKFWGSPFAGNLVVFLQDNISGAVIQSQSFPAAWPTAINEVNGGIADVNVYPNPAKENVNVSFNLDKAANVNVVVYDAAGRIVYNGAKAQLASGTQKITVPVNNLASGIYNLSIQTEDGSMTQRLTVE